MVRKLLYLCALALLHTTASADFNHGNAAFKRGDLETALREYKEAATQGHADAQYSVGVMYEDGLGVTRNRVEAARWYRMAAERGHANAQSTLGHMYHIGHGVGGKNNTEAARWFRMAAEQGNARGQYFLGFLYEFGYGVLQNNAEAARWYRLAAEQGHGRAQAQLDFMYERGLLVDQNQIEVAKQSLKPQASAEGGTSQDEQEVIAAFSRLQQAQKKLRIVEEFSKMTALTSGMSITSGDLAKYIDRQYVLGGGAHTNSELASEYFDGIIYSSFVMVDESIQMERFQVERDIETRRLEASGIIGSTAAAYGSINSLMRMAQNGHLGALMAVSEILSRTTLVPASTAKEMRSIIDNINSDNF